MVKETEIKLRVSRETLTALRDHPLLKKRNKSGWERHELFNQYFDTPARDLAQAKVALRIRRDGDAIIQTLKTRGHSVAGLSERNEYDWPLSKAKLDAKKLTAECWPASLAELDKKQLQAIFSTDFVREKAEIAWGRGKAKVVIEAALDLGCPPFRTFFTITLPLILPAVVSGFMLAFTLSLDDLVIASFTTGPGATTLPMRIYSQVRLGVTPEINAVCTILIAIVTVVVIVASLVTKRAENLRQAEERAALQG